MYYLKSFLSHPQKIHPNFPYYVSLEKNKKVWIFYLESEGKLANCVKFLRRFCVLSSFFEDYKVGKLLGVGHFAKVFLVEKIKSNELFAAKIIDKCSEVFKKNEVM